MDNCKKLQLIEIQILNLICDSDKGSLAERLECSEKAYMDAKELLGSGKKYLNTNDECDYYDFMIQKASYRHFLTSEYIENLKVK